MSVLGEMTIALHDKLPKDKAALMEMPISPEPIR